MKLPGLILALASVSQSFILPGTNYCGAGEREKTDEDFWADPIFPEVDNCCRAHDYCPQKIERFSTDFQLYNYYPYTISLCECDLAFWNCLKRDGSGMSTKVGQTFFNVLQTPCFELKKAKICQKYGYYGFGNCLHEIDGHVAEMRDAQKF